MITKVDIVNNKIYQFSGELSRENDDIINDWIFSNIEIKSHAKRIYGMINDIYDGFLYTDNPFDLVLSKVKNQYCIYFSTSTPHSVAIFLNKIITTKLNVRSRYERRIDYNNFIRRELELISGITTVLKKIMWVYYKLGRRINDPVQFNQYKINSDKSQIELIILT